MTALRKEVVLRASEVIDNEALNFEREGSTSPENYFDELACAFMHMRDFLSELGDTESAEKLDAAGGELRRVIEGTEWNGRSSSGKSRGWSAGGGVASEGLGATRDRFDDVDE